MSFEPAAKAFADKNTGLYKQRWLTCCHMGLGFRKHVPDGLRDAFEKFVRNKAGLNDDNVNKWIWNYLYSAHLRGAVPELPGVLNWNDYVKAINGARKATQVTASLFNVVGRLTKF